MAKSAIDFYHELLNDDPAVVSFAGLAAISAAFDEFDGRKDETSLSAFMARVDEILDSLADHLGTLRPGEPPE